MGLIEVKKLMILVLLRPGVKVEIVTVEVLLLIGEVKRVGKIIRPVSEKVINFAVIDALVLRNGQWLRLRILDVHELKRLLG